MNVSRNFKVSVVILLVIAIVSLSLKIMPILNYSDNFSTEEMYQVTYRYFFKTNLGETSIKTYLPKNNNRQRISKEVLDSTSTLSFEKRAEENNLKGFWTTNKENSYENINYSFVFEGKSKYFSLPENFNTPINYSNYLLETEHIQVHNSRISKLAKLLKTTSKNDSQLIKNIYNYVSQIPSAPIISLTDAVTVLEQNRASCNGKSRLLVALARNLGYPARIKGGIILEKTQKRTSHVWAEININNTWIPFDALNGHFAYLPANYMELYQGDKPLISRTAAIHFDYIYEIEKQAVIPFLSMPSKDFGKITSISLWKLTENKIMSTNELLLLLMLPIGGLVVAFLRNVVGLRTFGVFLPVLIGFSLLETGFVNGILLFLFLILFVGLISRPFNNMGLLHTPKLVVSLTLMVIVMTMGSYLGLITGISWLTSLTFFPTIILTISAERFSTLIVEDGFPKATGTLIQTLIAVAFCYFLLSNIWVSSIIILFPELLILVIAFSMLLGKYVGFRWTEILRFKPLLTFKTI